MSVFCFAAGKFTTLTVDPTLAGGIAQRYDAGGIWVGSMNADEKCSYDVDGSSCLHRHGAQIGPRHLCSVKQLNFCNMIQNIHQ